MKKVINSFDIDGVINMGQYDGVYPGPNDIIITGRSFEEKEETMKMLNRKGIKNEVHFNTLPFNQKTRKTSGQHKGRTMFYLEEMGYRIGIHFEDDPIQAEEIRKIMPHVKVVELKHNLVEKENVRHTEVVWHESEFVAAHENYNY